MENEFLAFEGDGKISLNQFFLLKVDYYDTSIYIKTTLVYQSILKLNWIGNSSYRKRAYKKVQGMGEAKEEPNILSKYIG